LIIIMKIIKKRKSKRIRGRATRGKKEGDGVKEMGGRGGEDFSVCDLSHPGCKSPDGQ
jgi:hypothetical protein